MICAERISARPKPNVKAPVAGPRGEPRGDEREPDRGRVGEHVRGVGQQRQRPGEQARDDLDGHEAGDERERDRQPAAVGVRGRRVDVPWPWA